MGRQGIKKQFWMSSEQAEDLARKAECACLTEAGLIRMLLSGYHPPQAPGDEFYKDLNRLIQTAEKIYLEAERAKDSEARKILSDSSLDLKRLSLEIRRRYLTGEREAVKWL